MFDCRFRSVLPTMFKHYLPCSNITYHVQTLPTMFKHYLPCSKTTYHVQTLPTMFKHYLPCSNTTYHVQTLPTMFKHYLPCSNITTMFGLASTDLNLECAHDIFVECAQDIFIRGMCARHLHSTHAHCRHVVHTCVQNIYLKHFTS